MKPPEGPLEFWVLGPLVVRRERWPIVLSAKQKALVALLAVYRLNVDPERIDSHRFERLTG